MTAMKTSLKAKLIATAIAALPLSAHAAGLGAINVFSGLGRPLRAEIELTATAEELQTLNAKIASVDAFRQANVTYSAAMPGMKFSVERRGNRSYVNVRSERPIDDPYVSMLVELSWAKGRLLRGYTFLLDPTNVKERQQVQADAAAARTRTPIATLPRPAQPIASRPAQTPAAPAAAAPVPPAPRPVEAAKPVQQAVPAQRPPVQQSQSSSRYVVKQGDTLARIAGRHQVAGANLDQMLIGLLRSNPSAFSNNNINRLRAGAVLNIPDDATVMSVDATEARREVVAQAADFNAYRRRLAGAAPTSSDTEKSAASRSDEGRITPKVTTPPSPADSGDQVKVATATPDSGKDRGSEVSQQRIQTLEEELAARDQDLKETQSRLTELERIQNDLKQLLELKNEELKQLQDRATSESGKTDVAVTPVEDTSESAKITKEDETEKKSSEEGESEPVVVTPVTPPEVTPVQEDPKPVEPAPAPTPPTPEPAAPAPEPPRPAPTPAPAPEPGVLDYLTNPLVLGGGGLIALLGGYFFYKRRNREEDGDETATDDYSSMADYPSEAQSVFGNTGGQSVDTGSTSIIHTDFSQSGLAGIGADEGVDPVAEADVYMAYGRDAQAEEILLDALKADPTHSGVYLKLLEIYAQRGSVRQFEAVATDLYSRTNGFGDDWQKAAQMGRKLDPDNPLYADRHGNDEAITEALPGTGKPSPSSEDVAAQLEAMSEDVFQESKPTARTSGEASQPSSSQLKDTWAMPGDLRQFSGASDEDIAKALEASQHNEETPKEDKPEPPPAAFGTPDTSSDLDFDLDLSATSPSFELPREDDAGSNKAPAQISSQDVAFDLDFEPTEPVPSQPEESPPPAAAPAEFKPAPPEPAAPVPVQKSDDDDAVMDLEQTGFDNDLLNFEFDLDLTSTQPTNVQSPESMDLDNYNVNLEHPTEMPTGSDEAGAGESEVDTKLDLARAYEEMGDTEGARELLEEVIKEGSSAQRESANRMLERLG